MSSRATVSPYRFRDEDQKKECILQSIQLSRDMLRSEFPKGVKDQTNLLIYLGVLYLLERTLTKRVSDADPAKRREIQKVFGLKSVRLSNYVETEAMLRKAAGRFFANPMKVALQLSGVLRSGHVSFPTSDRLHLLDGLPLTVRKLGQAHPGEY